MKSLKLLLILIILGSAPAYAGGVVLANKAVGIDTIKAKMLKKIFKGRVTLWKNGTSVTACYLKAESPKMDHFYGSIVGKSREKFNRFWVKKLFSGAGVAPKALENTTVILRLLASANGGICYLDQVPDSLPDNIKVITVQ